ncbi:MAG TPA: hypothetical protein VFK68_10925 [Propionibacteriaceae bacterium]|nr:hypothetical protein [Propionibacteriaceae bacterium]
MTVGPMLPEPPPCPEWCAAPAGHAYTGVWEDDGSLRRLHWRPIGSVDANGGPVRVSICAVETNTRGVATVSHAVVSLLTGTQDEDGSYVELEASDAQQLSEMVSHASRRANLAVGGRVS